MCYGPLLRITVLVRARSESLTHLLPSSRVRGSHSSEMLSCKSSGTPWDPRTCRSESIFPIQSHFKYDCQFTMPLVPNMSRWAVRGEAQNQPDREASTW